LNRVANILYLVHRLPFPPNKGDKVRSYHLLKHLAQKHRVYLGTFVDDPDDWQHVPTVRGLCADLHVAGLNPRLAKLASLRGLLLGEALSLPYYRNRGMSRWVAETSARVKFDAVVVFSSVMAQYAERLLPEVPRLIDFVDVDSAKWAEYAGNHAWPMSSLYRREGRALLDYEAAVAGQARASFFVTDKEAALFRTLVPKLRAPVESLCNGVDADFFSPDPKRASPFPAGQIPLVFTGAMDYWPNADAVCWFASEVLPVLRQQMPALHFHIVGRSPGPAVSALASECISVTGTVPDVRPYLQHAAAVVAPLRLARGIQNKILEAMAMARPVVAASSCVQAIDAVEGQDLIGAEQAEDYVHQLLRVLQSTELAFEVGKAGRARVLAAYSWTAHLSGIDRYLAGDMVAAASAKAVRP